MNIDLAGIFTPETPPLEIILRGTVTYLALFVLLRVTSKRESGSVGVSDLLVIVLIADAAQNAMADDYKSVTDGILLVATIIFWSYALNWLGYHVAFIQRLVYPSPLPLIEGGQLNRRNMRRELITNDELMSQLRLQGIDSVEAVERAYLEGNGELSVVKKEGDAEPRRSRPGL